MNQPVRILYVDDDSLDRELVRDALEIEHGGFELVEATSRADFETTLAQGGFDLILSDLNILGFEGLQVLETVRATGSHLPVIIVTGTGSEEIAAEAIRRGAADYVIKSPTHIQHLPHTIHAVLGKKRLEDEQKRSEEALRESEQKYRLLVDNASETIAVAQDGILKFVNRMASDLTGISEQELISRPFSEFIHPDDRGMVIERYLRRLKGDVAQPRYAFRFMARDGSIKWVEIDAVLIDWEGKPATLNFLTDITERKRVEEVLQESEARYRTLVENIPQKIFMKDRDSRFLSVNENFARDLGIQPADIVGKTDYDFYPKDLADKYRADDFRIMKTGQIEELDEKHMQEGGETWVHTIKTPVRDEKGEIVAILGVFWDITERKRAEMQLQEQLEELRRWYQATLGRETRLLELKREVNELLVKAGRPLRYPSAETENQ